MGKKALTSVSPAEERPAGGAEGPRLEQRRVLRCCPLLHDLHHHHHLLDGNVQTRAVCAQHTHTKETHTYIIY